MSINEIEFDKTSKSFRVFNFEMSMEAQELLKRIQDEPQFSVEPELSGFHDCEASDGTIRGFYSIVVPFEVECLIDGIQSKTLMKKIETCEFFAQGTYLFFLGKSDPQKIASVILGSFSGQAFTPVDLEFSQMSEFQNMLSTVKSISLTNPKNNEIRRARLTGNIEHYESSGIVDQKSHGIESVSGIIDSPLGPITVTISRKGTLKVNAKRGFILTVECLRWLMAQIVGAGLETAEDAHHSIESRAHNHARKLDGMLKGHGASMTMEHDGKSVTIGKEQPRTCPDGQGSFQEGATPGYCGECGIEEKAHE